MAAKGVSTRRGLRLKIRVLYSKPLDSERCLTLMPLMRSLLFVPGNRADMLGKALTLQPDVYIPDMEDSVPVNQKPKARETIASSLSKLASVGIPIIVRVNRIDSGLMEADLAAVVNSHINGVSVGKTGSGKDIRDIGDVLHTLERERGMLSESIKIIPWIETALGVQNVYEICSASPRVIAVAFGAEDFTADMGVERTNDGRETDYARNAVSIAAKAAGVIAFDTPYVRFKDNDGLRLDCIDARSRGFKGKFAIHPNQVEVINQTFLPTKSEIEEAQTIVKAYDEAASDGRGTLALDGKMIDEPVVARARGILQVAKTAQDSGQV